MIAARQDRAAAIADLSPTETAGLSKTMAVQLLELLANTEMSSDEESHRGLGAAGWREPPSAAARSAHSEQACRLTFSFLQSQRLHHRMAAASFIVSHIATTPAGLAVLTREPTDLIATVFGPNMHSTVLKTLRPVIMKVLQNASAADQSRLLDCVWARRQDGDQDRAHIDEILFTAVGLFAGTRTTLQVWHKRT